MPHLLLGDNEHIVIRAAGMAAVGRGRHERPELVAVALHRSPGALMVAQTDPDQIDHRVLHRHLNLLPLAGCVALHQRGQNPDGAVHAGARITDARPGHRRWRVRKTSDAHRTAHGLSDRLIALVVAVGTVGAKALDAGQDQAGVQALELRVGKAQTVQDARPEVFQQDITRFDQFAEHLFALGAFEVDRQAALIGVKGQKEQAVDARLIAQTGPGDIALAGFLNLDHLGSEPGQHLSTRRTGLVIGEVNYPNTGQRTGLGHVRAP